MKFSQTLIQLLLILALSSCKVAQVIYTGALSQNVNESDKCFFYENDTLKVTYVFWDYKGRMAFGVYNKLDVPIYIDWKKSSFINNTKKQDYYSDRVEKRTTSVTSAYSNNLNINWSNLFGPTAVGVTIGNEVSEREERVTFIPPRSYITRTSFEILKDGTHFTLAGAEEKSVPFPDDTSRYFKSYVVKIDDKSPTFIFRNFLTYSVKETFEREQYVSNEFYIRKVMTIKQGIFDKYAFSSEKRFYIDQINKSDL
ncbi:MAG: hypothetical protein IPN22_14745 [Bacteroidetes bacterium]|nr:hypothetical protein [Bacteroidota bacterium]